MRRTLSFLAVFILCASTMLDGAKPSQNGTIEKFPVGHQFSLWGALRLPSEKSALYFGFTNGLFLANRTESFRELAACLESVSYDQATAMIDKYYSDNPQLWNKSLGSQIVNALTVKDGPCPDKNPWK
jgi:hypothetical protein